MKFAFVAIAFLTLLDQGSKILVRYYVPLYEGTVLLPNFLELTHVENKGVSFSFLADLPKIIRLPLLLSVSTIAVVGMLYYLIRYWHSIDSYLKLALIWIIPGALGNLIDRAIFGAVTDFLHFRWYDISFFVNNLADCLISIGVVFFVCSTLFAKPQEQQKTEPSSETSPPPHNH